MDKLFYKNPARDWKEALPIGNGKTGVMIYGGKTQEKLCFNDATLWSGYPKDYNSPKSLENLNKVRQLIFDGKNHEADELAYETMRGGFSESYLPLGFIKIKYRGINTENYERSLDIKNAIHTVKANDVLREAFSSYPDKISVYKTTCGKPFGMEIKADSRLKHKVSYDSGINLFGNAPDYDAPRGHKEGLIATRYNEHKAMAFCLRTEIETDGEVIYKFKKAIIKNATRVTLYFATATGFISFNKMPEASTDYAIDLCKKALKNTDRDYDKLKENHIRDFSNLYNRQSISLCRDENIPTDELIESVKQGASTAPLSELFYNYGKYLMISGSRAGGQPLNLQGIWNDEVRPPWCSNYTININTEMNYWGASRSGLSQCIEPLIKMVLELIENGRKTAKINYGCEGFACNHNVDIWRKTPPVANDVRYMFSPLCGVWLANEVSAHYLNGELNSYRENVIKIAEQAAKFAKDFLVLHNDFYVICPSVSPENAFKRGGSICCLDYGSAYDMALVRQCFDNAKAIIDNENLIAEINAIIPKLYPFKKSKIGMCEYHDDYEMPERGHRHFSPLYAFYPANQIGYYSDKEKTEWVRTLFHDRLDNSGHHIGWSAAWAICIAARLREKDTAEKVIKNLLCNAVFDNLFCFHPPTFFQIDGNFGFIAAVNELLLSQDGDIIELLPALPSDFKDGSATGMLVHGAKISFEFKNGEIISASSTKPMKIMNKHFASNAKINENIILI